MTNGPHTLGVGYGSLLERRALRVWIGSRLNSSGKCRFEDLASRVGIEAPTGIYASRGQK